MNALHAPLLAKKHVIWDWNGTLLADLDHALRTVNRMLREEGLPPTTMENYKMDFGFPVVDYYRHLGFSTEPVKYAALCEKFNDYFYAGLGECQLWPGVRETLEFIKASGKTQSVLSATEHGMLETSIKFFQLNHVFDHIQGIGDKKAGSKIAQGHQLMRNAGIAASETIMIGDTDHDHQVAQALGIDVILVDHGHQSGSRLRKIHHTVIQIF